MEIQNESQLAIHEPLWQVLAGKLFAPKCLDSFGESRLTGLQVTIQVPRTRVGDEVFLYGQYTESQIEIVLCKKCTSGTALVTFLHELMHHWLFIYHDSQYDKPWVEEFCENVAGDLFRSVGGAISSGKGCERFEIVGEPRMPHRKSLTSRMINRLNRVETSSLASFVRAKKWRA